MKKSDFLVNEQQATFFADSISQWDRYDKSYSYGWDPESSSRPCIRLKCGNSLEFIPTKLAYLFNELMLSYLKNEGVELKSKLPTQEFLDLVLENAAEAGTISEHPPQQVSQGIKRASHRPVVELVESDGEQNDASDTLPLVEIEEQAE